MLQILQNSPWKWNFEAIFLQNSPQYFEEFWGLKHTYTFLHARGRDTDGTVQEEKQNNKVDPDFLTWWQSFSCWNLANTCKVFPHHFQKFGDTWFISLGAISINYSSFSCQAGLQIQSTLLSIYISKNIHCQYKMSFKFGPWDLSNVSHDIENDTNRPVSHSARHQGKAQNSHCITGYVDNQAQPNTNFTH